MKITIHTIQPYTIQAVWSDEREVWAISRSVCPLFEAEECLLEWKKVHLLFIISLNQICIESHCLRCGCFHY